jgi:hypothetical protein
MFLMKTLRTRMCRTRCDWLRPRPEVVVDSLCRLFYLSLLPHFSPHLFLAPRYDAAALACICSCVHQPVLTALISIWGRLLATKEATAGFVAPACVLPRSLPRRSCYRR